MSQQNLWKPIQGKPGLEVAVYTRLPEAYKTFLPQATTDNVDKVVNGKDPLDNKEMTYKMKYSDQYDSYSVLRWEKKAGSGAGAQRFSPTISIGVQLVDIEQANKLLKLNQDAGSGVYYKITGNPVLTKEQTMIEGSTVPYEEEKVKVVLELVLKKNFQPEAPKPVSQQQQGNGQTS